MALVIAPGDVDAEQSLEALVMFETWLVREGKSARGTYDLVVENRGAEAADLGLLMRGEVDVSVTSEDWYGPGDDEACRILRGIFAEQISADRTYFEYDPTIVPTSPEPKVVAEMLSSTLDEELSTPHTVDSDYLVSVGRPPLKRHVYTVTQRERWLCPVPQFSMFNIGPLPRGRTFFRTSVDVTGAEFNRLFCRKASSGGTAFNIYGPQRVAEEIENILTLRLGGHDQDWTALQHMFFSFSNPLKCREHYLIVGVPDNEPRRIAGRKLNACLTRSALGIGAPGGNRRLVYRGSNGQHNAVFQFVDADFPIGIELDSSIGVLDPLIW